MINPMDLSGKTIVVTGASSGIGKATAILLSQLGARLVLVARRENLLEEAVQALDPGDHSYFAFDLSKTDEIEGLVRDIVARAGPVDGLVYAAGISVNTPLPLVKPEKLLTTYRINICGFLEIARQLTKKKNCNDGMSVVGISSTASLRGEKGAAMYASSKAAMNAAVRVMAHELSEKGIRVNAVAPGMTATAMLESFTNRLGTDSETYRQLLKRQYLGIIRPQAVASAIAFLLSPASDFITGVTLPVDGGMTSS